MLDETERQFIEAALIDYLTVRDGVWTTIVTQLNHARFAGSLAQNLAPRAMVLQAIQLCLGDKWASAPPWLASLIDIIPVDFDTDGRLAHIRLRILNPPPPPDPADDVLNATILSGDMPFINRHPLRAKLRNLATPATRQCPILVINGPVKVGKSYSRHFIDHLSGEETSITINPLEFDPDLGLETGPKEVAVELATFMGSLADPPENDTNQKLYIRRLAQWVFREAIRSGRNHWFILDNFKGERLRQDTRDLLIEMAEIIVSGVFPETCRLVLIDFDKALLSVAPGKVDEERLLPAPEADVKAAFNDAIRRCGLSLNLDQVEALLLHQMPNGEDKMTELNTCIKAMLLATSEVKAIAETLDIEVDPVVSRMLEGLPFGAERMPTLKARLEALRESSLGM